MKKPTASSKPKASGSATGAIAANFHEGSRSEVLADYVFSGWGTVTPVRRQDDFGIDLYCTLTERRRKRAVVTDYFVVQVKSTNDPWEFNSRDSVKWLIDYPQPLFLACVDKHGLTLRVYHVTPRFLVASLPPLPNCLTLNPEDSDNGSMVQWSGGTEFSLSAPILRIKLSDLMNHAVMVRMRTTFTQWVRIDRENCDLRSRGLLRFRMPDKYTVNEPPSQSNYEMGNSLPNLANLGRGILNAAEAAECIGGQLGRHGDRAAALYAALFVHHLQQHYADAFAGQLRWKDRIPGDLGQIACSGLNAALASRMPNRYYYEGLENVERALQQTELVAAFLDGSPTTRAR